MQFFKTLFGADASTLTAADAKARMAEHPQMVVLDVRQPDEFKGGHISGAKLIPLNDLPRRMAELPKETEILCVCRSGSRSSVAVSMLRRAGYNVMNLRGGMMGWQGAGFLVKKGK